MPRAYKPNDGFTIHDRVEKKFTVTVSETSWMLALRSSKLNTGEFRTTVDITFVDSQLLGGMTGSIAMPLEVFLQGVDTFTPLVNRYQDEQSLINQASVDASKALAALNPGMIINPQDSQRITLGASAMLAVLTREDDVTPPVK